MSDTAIRVEHLSKQYQIGESVRQDSLREALTHGLRAGLGRIAGGGARGQRAHRGGETFWALKDVSFEVKRGEVVGIIGRNGAGKSTLLKILSRITEPTGGVARIHGRVGSLLEVGTGFHPELTGRENIYLNGAILGMKRAEIARKFDEMVAFAEIERFLDTPVKRYSSGMYVRLAFAVAAHLEPEILLVDEVLAVGDVAFQRKCLGKMGRVAKEGRTVLFVSHQMDAIGTLCPETILFEEGQIALAGPTPQAVRRYLNGGRQAYVPDTALVAEHFRAPFVRCHGATVTEPIYPLRPMIVEVDVQSTTPTRDLSMHFLVLGSNREPVLGFDSRDFGVEYVNPPDDPVRFRLEVPQCPLPPGDYTLRLYAKSYSNQMYEAFEPEFDFTVCEDAVYGGRNFNPRWHGRMVAEAKMQVFGTSPQAATSEGDN